MGLVYSIFSSLVRPLVGSGIGRVKPLASLYQKVMPRILPATETVVEVKGFKMKVLTEGHVGDMATELLFKKVHEPVSTRIFEKLVKGNDYVVDIGANTGYFTMLAAKLVGWQGRVLAFEPDIENISILKQNAKLNNFENIILYPVALSNTIGEAKFYTSSRESARHSLIRTKEHDGQTKVSVMRLDDVPATWDAPISLLKTDTEGNELAVLKGAEKTILRNHDIKLIVEVYEEALRACGVSVDNLWSYIAKTLEFNYIYVVDDYSNTIKLLDDCIFTRKLACNFLCSRSGVGV